MNAYKSAVLAVPLLAVGCINTVKIDKKVGDAPAVKVEASGNGVEFQEYQGFDSTGKFKREKTASGVVAPKDYALDAGYVAVDKVFSEDWAKFKNYATVSEALKSAIGDLKSLKDAKDASTKTLEGKVTEYEGKMNKALQDLEASKKDSQAKDAAVTNAMDLLKQYGEAFRESLKK